jgi:hypothetical protein
LFTRTVETLNNWQHPLFVNVFGCADYGYGELGKGLRLGETAQVLGACTNSYAFGGVAVIYFCFVVGVGVSCFLIHECIKMLENYSLFFLYQFIVLPYVYK